jgi:hypothetical protein
VDSTGRCVFHFCVPTPGQPSVCTCTVVVAQLRTVNASHVAAKTHPCMTIIRFSFDLMQWACCWTWHLEADGADKRVPSLPPFRHAGTNPCSRQEISYGIPTVS